MNGNRKNYDIPKHDKLNFVRNRFWPAIELSMRTFRYKLNFPQHPTYQTFYLQWWLTHGKKYVSQYHFLKLFVMYASFEYRKSLKLLYYSLVCVFITGFGPWHVFEKRNLIGTQR